jgi:hypothetical protein
MASQAESLQRLMEFFSVVDAERAARRPAPLAAPSRPAALPAAPPRTSPRASADVVHPAVVHARNGTNGVAPGGFRRF